MTVFNITLLAVLILLGLAFVLAPIRRPFHRTAGEDPSRLQELDQEKRRLLELIRDLEFDREVGKVLDEDYGTSLADYKSRAVQVMKEMDALMPSERIEKLVDREIEKVRSSLKKASGQ
jgi:hypothetical protein